MAESLSIFLKLVWLFCPYLVDGSVCPQYCHCSEASTDCTIIKGNPFPLSLDPKTKILQIDYKGNESFTLTGEMLDYYPHLVELTIKGNLDHVAERAFQRSKLLRNLTIHYSTLKVLHYNIFGDENDLDTLILSDNRLLPQLPFEIFSSLTELRSLDLSYNDFRVCNGKDSIGEEFKQLRQLQSLNLAGLGSEEDCKGISHNFFAPIEHVTHLNLSESGFFHGDLSILKPLSGLTFLSLNNVSPFNKCPSKVQSLFGNLSTTLQHIEAERWRYQGPLDTLCYFNNETLSGLQNMTDLAFISFEYGDRPFATVLRKGIFRFLTHLQSLNFGWSRIATIEDGALDGLKISKLHLQDNPIGQQPIWGAGRNQPMESVLELDLSDCGIFTDASFNYNASFLLQSFPNLGKLGLSRNMLLSLPIFSNPEALASPSSIHTLDLFSNLIKRLSYQEMSALCHVMPALNNLYIPQNEIVSIELLCPTLKALHAKENAIEFSQNPEDTFKYHNYQTIKNLTNMVYLDLSDNKISIIPNDIFYQMVKMSHLNLIGNQIVSLDNNMFLYNANLQSLYLSNNRLTTFDSKLLNHCKALERLMISQNKISLFDVEFVNEIESKDSLRSVRIDENPFDCSCGQLFFQSWVQRSKKLKFGQDLQCVQPSNLLNQKISEYKQPQFQCVYKWVVDGVAGLVGLVLIIIVTYQLRWYLTNIPYLTRSMRYLRQQDECHYDAMVIFNSKSNKDTDWVKELMRELEGGDYPQPINIQEPDGRVSVIAVEIDISIIT